MRELGDSAMRGKALLIGLGGAAGVSYAAGLLVRAPETADLSLLLAVNGPRLLLAAAVGAGLAASSAAQPEAGPGASSRSELLVFGLSAGAAVGGMRALDWSLLGLVPDFVLGAIAGAALGAALLRGLARVPRVGRWLAGLAMLALLAATLPAAVDAKGNPDGFRPVVWWLLGDFSSATWAGAGLASAAVLAVVAALLSRAEGDPWHPAADPARRRNVSLLAALLWGVAIGAGGVIAWFGLMVSRAAYRLAGGDRRSWLALSAFLGAAAMMWAEALPRLLIGGYAFPIEIGVAVVAIPFYLATRERRERPVSRGAAIAVRSVDIALALLTFAGMAAVLGFLTYIVYLVG